MGDHKQDLVVVCEVERNGYAADLAEVMAAIRRAVSDHRELPVRAIVLTKVGGFPRRPAGSSSVACAGNCFSMPAYRSTVPLKLDGSADMLRYSTDLQSSHLSQGVKEICADYNCCR